MANEPHSHEFHLNSPFPPGSFELVCAARRIAKGVQQSSVVFVGCPISGFIAKESEEQSDNRIGRAWWYGVTPLVICTGPNLADACFAVLTPKVRGVGAVQKFFDRSRFPHALVSSTHELDQIADRIRDALHCNERQGVDRHTTQERFAEPLRSYFGDEIDNAEFGSLLEEVALSSIIELPDWSADDYRTRWTRKRPKVEEMTAVKEMYVEWMVDHGNKTSFDFLCTREAPRLFPSLAIEFDGPKHDSEPAKIFNDRLKDLVCREAGLPLLRVGVDFAGPSPSDPKNYGYVMKSYKRHFAAFASTFVWFTASAWEQAVKRTDRSNIDSIGLEAARVKTLHKEFPTIANVHLGLTSDLSLREKYHESIGSYPEITVERHDAKGIQASMKLDRLTFQSPWLRIRGGVPRPWRATIILTGQRQLS